MTGPPDPSAPIRAAVNKGGYPFQLAVEEHIRRLPSSENWQFISHEVPHEDGYLDIIAHRSAMIVGIECKKLAQDWIFLVPQGANDNENRLRVYVIHRDPSGRSGLEDVTTPVGSYESSFCQMHNNSGSMTLERLSRDLTQSIVNIAWTPGRMAHSDVEVFLPIIVTTAKLQVCLYDPARLNVATGDVNPDARCVDVDMIRFRKTFSQLRSSGVIAQELLIRDMIRVEEQTVIVCRGSYIATLMRDLARYGINDVDENPIRRTS